MEIADAGIRIKVTKPKFAGGSKRYAQQEEIRNLPIPAEQPWTGEKHLMFPHFADEWHN